MQIQAQTQTKNYMQMWTQNEAKKDANLDGENDVKLDTKKMQNWMKKSVKIMVQHWTQVDTKKWCKKGHKIA